ncbi:hypothetical protein ACA910_018340 [Epithemia clementina (nom. ined.)]
MNASSNGQSTALAKTEGKREVSIPISQHTTNPLLIGIKPVDVLLGRGKGSYDWEGNVVYKQLLESHLPVYIAATKNRDKIQITNMIVAQVKSTGGRFLGIENICAGENGIGGAEERLYEISDSAARLKVAQVGIM